MFLAYKFRDKFSEIGVKIELEDIFKINRVKSVSNYDFISVFFPVYAFYPPKDVLEFVKDLPNVKDKPCFLVSSFGGTSGNSLTVLKKILEKKGYFVISSFGYVMPANSKAIFGKDSESEIKEIVSRAEENLEKDFKDLIDGENKYYKPNLFLRIFSKPIYYFFNKKFYHNKKLWGFNRDKCISCGLCEKICPVENITFKKKIKQVKFSDKCVGCSRCFNFCPTGAIYKDKKKNPKRYRYFLKYFK